MWWCIKYFTIFGLTGLVLWGRFARASEPGCPRLLLSVGNRLLFVPSLPLWHQPCAYLSPREVVRGGAVFSPSPLPVRAGLVSQLEPHPEHRCRVGSGRQRAAGALRTRGRTGTPAVSAALAAARLTPALSDALLLKADTLPSEKSL